MVATDATDAMFGMKVARESLTTVRIFEKLLARFDACPDLGTDKRTVVRLIQTDDRYPGLEFQALGNTKVCNAISAPPRNIG
jgi:hypothetical protein